MKKNLNEYLLPVAFACLIVVYMMKNYKPQKKEKLLLRLYDEVIVLKNETQGKYKMAPYTPPNTHYSQLDVSAYSEEDIFKFIGQGGKRFYWLTKFLDLAYLWYDKKRRVIEIWGPFESLQNFQSHHVIECELDFACNKT